MFIHSTFDHLQHNLFDFVFAKAPKILHASSYHFQPNITLNDGQVDMHDKAKGWGFTISSC
jgi:hypothetical protein